MSLVTSQAPTADYEEIWTSRWGDMQRYGPASRHQRRIVSRMVRGLDFESVLDVGCGEGSLLATLRKEWPDARLAGVDLSEAAVRRAVARCPDAVLRVGDVSAVPEDERYDLVTCLDVVEHVVDDEGLLRALAARSRRYVLCSSVQGRMRVGEEAIGHVRNYAPGELTEKVVRAALAPVHSVAWGFPFYSPIFRSLVSADAPVSQGRFGPGRRLACEALYALFLLNSWKRGDRLLVLAEKR